MVRCAPTCTHRCLRVLVCARAVWACTHMHLTCLHAPINGINLRLSPFHFPVPGVSVLAFQLLHCCWGPWCSLTGQTTRLMTFSGDVTYCSGAPVSPGQVDLGGWEVLCVRLDSCAQRKWFSLSVVPPEPQSGSIHVRTSGLLPSPPLS